MIAPDKQPIKDWPDTPRIVNEVAARLQEQHDKDGIQSEVLKREIETVGGYAKESVLPSDYCYNSMNKAPASFQYRLLTRLGRGRYTYIGPNHSCTGPILWKPKQGTQQQVGSWSNGDEHLDFGPRT